jgi:membrane protein DedA with SNARE-associated domain
MFATFAIPAAALGGLIWCGLLLLLLDVAFGVKFDRERRLTLVGVAIVATYIGYLIAIGYNLVRDARKR